MNRRLLASLGFIAFQLVSTPASAIAIAPDLGSAYGYTVLGLNAIPTVGTVTCTTSTINGDVGTTANSITNTSCTINGAIDAPVNASVITDFNSAYTALDTDNPTCDGVIPTTNATLLPGVYCSDAGTTIGAGVILTLDGNASDVWVFKVGTTAGGALTGNSFQVVMAGTAQACNVYWWTEAGATLTDSTFKGTILSGAAFSMTGGSYEGRAFATTDATVTNGAPITFAGCAAPASITVIKDFSPDNAATVPVALTCTTGTVITTPLNASEGAPAVFTVGAADPGATCTATETVPTGYTADQTDCVSVGLDGSCTIVNTLIPPAAATITVNKDFSPNSATVVPVALTCTSGTVSATPLNAAEGAPAVFTVTGASLGTTCRATETVPTGYTADQTGCLAVALNGSCTIVNTAIPPGAATITVNKDFSPDSAVIVPVALSCTSGTVTASPLNAAEGAPAVFAVTGADPGATCMATETVPPGYTADQTGCLAVALNGSCTIVNTIVPSAPIPSLTKWGVILLAALLAIAGFAARRGRSS